MTVSQPTFKGQNEREVYFESSLFINNMKEFDLVANLNELSFSRENSNSIIDKICVMGTRR